MAHIVNAVRFNFGEIPATDLLLGSSEQNNSENRLSNFEMRIYRSFAYLAENRMYMLANVVLLFRSFKNRVKINNLFREEMIEKNIHNVFLTRVRNGILNSLTPIFNYRYLQFSEFIGNFLGKDKSPDEKKLVMEALSAINTQLQFGKYQGTNDFIEPATPLLVRLLKNESPETDRLASIMIANDFGINNYSTTTYSTPLSYALRVGEKNLVNILKKKGACIHQQMFLEVLENTIKWPCERTNDHALQLLDYEVSRLRPIRNSHASILFDLDTPAERAARRRTGEKEVFNIVDTLFYKLREGQNVLDKKHNERNRKLVAKILEKHPDIRKNIPNTDTRVTMGKYLEAKNTINAIKELEREYGLLQK